MPAHADRPLRWSASALLALLLGAAPLAAQESAPPPYDTSGRPAALGERAPDVGEPESHALELQLRGGVSVATIQVDGTAATGFLPGISLGYRSGMMLLGASFDGDPGVSPSADDGTGETRSGWHLAAFIGPTFALTSTSRFDLTAEVGLHQLSDAIVSSASSYSTSATLPYFGLRPAVSVQFGSGRFTGAVGAALFYRLDAGQRQASGLPDDGGHQLGGELFLALRIGVLGGP